jgi:hypothetical protein
MPNARAHAPGESRGGAGTCPAQGSACACRRRARRRRGTEACEKQAARSRIHTYIHTYTHTHTCIHTHTHLCMTRIVNRLPAGAHSDKLTVSAAARHPHRIDRGSKPQQQIANANATHLAVHVRREPVRGPELLQQPLGRWAACSV